MYHICIRLVLYFIKCKNLLNRQRKKKILREINMYLFVSLKHIQYESIVKHDVLLLFSCLQKKKDYFYNVRIVYFVFNSFHTRTQ